MPAPVLATKLYAPSLRARMVARPRLIERLNTGLHRKLTVVSAPAGFGKTTLVRSWVESSGRQVAWLSLDEGDSDLNRFLTYLVAALQSISAEIGAAVLPTLQSSQPIPVESILTTLINDISNIPVPMILVLDDYHVLDSKPVDEALIFLLEHLPPHMHLAITSREDPNLPLARFRVRDQLTELRVADLRFTPSEAAEFLNPLMGLDLSTEEVAILETRTEGWVAGLQLAALSMQTRQDGSADISAFIRAFAGDHRYIMDYLVEEVLKHQPQSLRSFLLQTSILDRLNGPLCDAVTGQDGGSERLEALQRGNFFVIPLDDSRHWYRYHHLFGEVLRTYLLAEQAAETGLLHRRASEWYEQNNLPAEAIRHALAGEDFARAADLVERIAPVMRQSRQEADLLSWLRKLPEDLIRQRPVLCNLYAGSILQTGELEGVETWLQAAERWVDPADRITPSPGEPLAPSGQRIVANEEEFSRLPGGIAIHRAGLSLMAGDFAGTIQSARRALELIPEDDHLGQGAGSALLGLATWATGDLEAARRLYASSLARLLRAGHTSDAIGLSISLADIQLTQGCLGDALHTYERGYQLATQAGPVLRGAADMLVGMSEIYRERNDFQAATQHLLKSKELGGLKELGQNPYRWRLVMARIAAAQGDLDGALDLLDEAERVYMSDFSPNVRPIAAARARVWAAHGRLDEAIEWAQKRGLSVEDPLDYLGEYEHISLARVRLAQHRRAPSEGEIRETIGLLERLLHAAEGGDDAGGGRTGSLIEILILQALAHQMLPGQEPDDITPALAPLERALRLAEPEGYIRLFVDEGPPMAKLLGAVARHGILPEYTSNLLRAFQEQPDAQAAPQVRPVPGVLVEPLSDRELDVLRLFQTELSGPEIARELVIALSTVRTHTKNIYSKLNVNNRRAAVNRAKELGLI